MLKTTYTTAETLIRRSLRPKSGATLLTLSLLFLPLSIVAQDKPKVTPTKPAELSELSRLKAENFLLRTQLTQCRVDLLDRESKIASATLTGQQSKFEVEFMKELGCNTETQKFNWQTLACDAKTPLPIIK